MFETHADEYWKGREEKKRSDRNRKVAAAAVAAVLLLAGAGAAVWRFSKNGSAPAEAAEAPRIDEHPRFGEYKQLEREAWPGRCEAACRAREEAQCKAACAQYEWEAPRPTVRNSCYSGCRTAQGRMCRRSCVALTKEEPTGACGSGDEQALLCRSACARWERRLPRPLLHVSCKHGCEQVLQPACEAAGREVEVMRAAEAAWQAQA